VATGELSCWPALVEGDDRIGWVIETAVNEGLRVDGHAPGASRQRLGQLLAAGITACHEAIRGKELITRISSGYWTEIRHSDLRPDGPELARALVDSGLPTDRVLLTTDGPEAESLAAGHLDRVIEIVVTAGVDPIPAIKMATLNVATYLGLDAHLGAIAPGRCADILAVRTLDRPSPERTWIAGQSPPAEPSTIEWEHLTANPIRLAPLREDDLASFSPGTPGIALEGVVTRAVSNPGEPLPADWVRAYLVNRGGQTITGAPLHGAGSIDGFASSATGYGHVLVVGTDPGAMLDAYRRVAALGGGTVCAGGPELPLPILGTMTDDSFAALLTARSLLRRELGQRGFSVCSLDYFSLFLSLGVIPEIKLIDRGVLDVKRRRILVPARSLR
jgi:adenine deaminase